MNKSRFPRLQRKNAILILSVLLFLAGLSQVGRLLAAQSAAQPTSPNEEATLLDGFRHVEVASVSDAMEQIAGRKMYMTHRMQPIFPAKFAGLAITLWLHKAEANNDPAALNGKIGRASCRERE